MMLRDLVPRFTSAVVLLGVLAAPAAGAEAGGPANRVVAGEGAAAVDALRPRIARNSKPPVFGCENPFRLRLERAELPKDDSGISEILVQVYDPEAGKWRGYGLMELRRERPEAGPMRITGAAIDFFAPAEGIYSLRAVARDGAGNIDRMPGDLTDVRWTVVFDRTPPRIRLISPKPSNVPLRPGSRINIEWEYDEKASEAYPAKGDDVHRVQVSYDGGRTWKQIHSCAEPEIFRWKVEGPNTDAFLVRVAVRDAAGNLGFATTEAGGRLSGFLEHQFGGPALIPSAARHTYQRGVIYMTRAQYKEAIEHFEEAIRLDRTVLRAHVDLSATYLQLYDYERRNRRYTNRSHLDKARKVCEDALKIEGFEREISLHHNLAQALWRDDRLEEAAARLETGLKLQPRHVASLYSLAYIRWRQRDEAARRGDEPAAKEYTSRAKTLWQQVAALGGGEHQLARQAVRCLEVLDRLESQAATEKQKAAEAGTQRTSAAPPLPKYLQLQ